VACYPAASRATGVSWANGIGRIGSVLGSMLGGLMLSLGWSMPAIFAGGAAPPSLPERACSPWAAPATPATAAECGLAALQGLRQAWIGWPVLRTSASQPV
jgi:MFS transporter, AAHS family, 4-hydroxybenzoate transporter